MNNPVVDWQAGRKQLGSRVFAFDTNVPSSSSGWFEEFQRRNTERVLARPTQLPLWPDVVRGVPNGVLRSALFGAIKRGKRKYLQRESIAAQDGVLITYTGLRLDQSDLDVWEGALHLARGGSLGNRIEFTEKGFLRLIGRGGLLGKCLGKSDREWLRNVFSRLSATTIEIKQGPYVYGGSLVDEYFRDECSGRCVLVLNASLKGIFSRDGWTKVDWRVRQELRGHPLAQWLHGFYSTHAKPYPIKVETLHRLCGSQTGERAASDADWRRAIQGWRDASLIPALGLIAQEVKRVSLEFFWDINSSDLVIVRRNPLGN